jgi:threonine dehydrogenase-like Zn-dependent dehydrogenase
MRALFYAGPERLEWRDVSVPRLQGPGEAIVGPLAVAACDLDRFIVRGVTRFPPGMALGHECVAQVIEIGDAVRSVAPGDIVCVPFQIACGSCDACRHGHTGNCKTVGPATTYGFGVRGTSYGGMYADRVRVPFAEAMLVKVPEGIAPTAAASVGDNVADAYRAVAPFVDARSAVLVLGGLAASIGLYAVGVAAALGAARVDYLDDDADRLARARALGARAIEGTPETPPGRYTLTVDASGTAQGLRCALQSLAFEGTCFVVAMDFGNATTVPLLDMYVTGVTLKTGRAHARPSMPSVLELIASGRLRPELVTSDVVTPEETPERLLRGGYAKLVTNWVVG